MNKNEKKSKFVVTKEELKEKVHQTDEFVRHNPYKTVGIVAGVSAGIGAIVGFILGKKKKKPKVE